ncbi:MAG: leucine-rich repeat protein, partial [Kiritimatiellae bacterium]|nr:leucine-rich repeat protein [Kiritimatiellia bacterium]
MDCPLSDMAESLVVTLDGEELFSSTESVQAVWQPQRLGEQMLTYTSGDTTLGCFVNVTAFSYSVQEEPNPPMGLDSAISIAPLTRNFTAAGGANAIVTSGSGTWSASVSASWITLNATSGTAGYPVAYAVDANANVEQRVGYVYVSGHVHTITQKGVGATISPTSGTFENEGGTLSIAVTAPSQITWQARSNTDWISVSPTSGEGEGSVSYTVAPFDQVSTRQGSITVAGNTVTVFQYGRRMMLESYSESKDWHTHVIPITVNALAITEWSVTPNASWISVVDGGNGKGGDLVSIAIAENPSYVARTGTVTIGTETFTVTQSGRTDLIFSVSPEASAASVNGANGLIAVTATPDLPWSAKSNANWLTVSSTTATGAGNGNVVYVASPQSTLYDRTGTITVTPDAKSGMPARKHKVIQPGAESALSRLGYEFEASGESCAINVSLSNIVQWEIVENLDWLTVNGATSGVGPSTVVLQASANETIYPRSGTIKIAEKTFTVSQKARGVEVEYENIIFDTDGGSESISIHPDGNVSWTAVASDPTWITIFQGDSGTGDGEIMYIISPYVGDGGSRTGTITVGDKVVYITQRAYAVSISPNGTTVSGNNGEGEFGVSANINEIWNAIVTEPWVTIISGYDSGTGSGTVRFIYTDNNTGKPRTGKIFVNGEVYTIEQSARTLINITAIAERGGSVSGSGTYGLGTEATLTAVPNDGYAFSYWTGDIESMQNPLTFRVDVAKSVTAVFEPLPLTLISAESDLTGVTLTWNNLAWASTYRIYRGETSVPSSARLVAEIPNVGVSTYLDTTGVLDQVYWYWIEAEGEVESEMSNPMTGRKGVPVVLSQITYENLNGATHENPEFYEEGKSLSFVNPSSVEGYTFAGWVPNQITTEMTGAQTIRATWIANQYTITYSANGGSGLMGQTSATYGEPITLPKSTFVKEGFYFKGWAVEPNGRVVYGNNATVSNLTSEQNGVVTLYAIWGVPSVTPEEFFVYSIENATRVTITGLQGDYPEEIGIPKTIEGLPVCAFSLGQFDLYERVTSITFPDIEMGIYSICETENVPNLQTVFFKGFNYSMGCCWFPSSAIGYYPARYAEEWIRMIEDFGEEGGRFFNLKMQLWEDEIVTPEDIALSLLWFHVADNEVAITGIKKRDYSEPLLIPETINGLPVTSIGESAFSGCSGLTSVTIPSSVTSIGDYAFSGCSGLTSVTIPSSVTSIGERAFSGCSGLIFVTIPSGITSIGSYAFEGVAPEHLTASWLPEGMSGSNLKTLIISDGAPSIGDYAFSGCSGLTSVTIPSSVTWIGYSAFYGCSGLTSVTISEGV